MENKKDILASQFGYKKDLIIDNAYYSEGDCNLMIYIDNDMNIVPCFRNIY